MDSTHFLNRSGSLCRFAQRHISRVPNPDARRVPRQGSYPIWKPVSASQADNVGLPRRTLQLALAIVRDIEYRCVKD